MKRLIFFCAAVLPLAAQAQNATPDASEITIIHAGPQTAVAAPPEISRAA